MPKFYGKIGFMVTEEADPVNHPGVYSETVTEQYYSGDHMSAYTSRWNGTSKLNDDTDVSTRIAILADPFAVKNFNSIRYVEWLGSFWKVTSVEVQFPKLILTVGGVYNKPDEVQTNA